MEIDPHGIALERSPPPLALASFYQFAKLEGLTASSPVENVKHPRLDADFSSTRGLSVKESRELCAAARADWPRSYAVVSVLLNSGIHISEALNANLSDLQHDRGHRVLVVTRTGGKRAKVILNHDALESLTEMLGPSVSHGSELASLSSGNADAPIFRTRTGNRWALSEAFRTVQRLALEAGREGRINPHSLRHTHATDSLAQGMPLHELHDSLGHADPRTNRRHDRARNRLEKSSGYVVAGLYS